MEERFPLYRVLEPDGTLDEAARERLPAELRLSLYRQMVLARTFDRKAVNLQRTGRIGTYAPFEGQEAAQVGSAAALDPGDWLFPTYRDHAATMTFGQPLLTILLYWSGRLEGCVPPEGKHILPPYVPIATQIPHAVGAAWAAKLRGEKTVTLVYFGDGAASEGDFHEGLNFAGVFQVPVVFFCQNNGYAISVPFARQSASRTIAQRALAYDMEGVRVDGNDVLAVYLVTKKALDRARAGGGPTLIEAVTWRYGAHTTADDPTKYRDQQESQARRAFDPVDRLRRHLMAEGLWDDEQEAALLAECDARVSAAVRELEAYPPADVAHLYDFVLAELPWFVREQREAALARKKEGASAWRS
ncbi:pyruvate dehydrogenase (acetyl-transferring) E1 component subunit alpha [Calditerricola satsumensis]|uniref:Pyruvate dehydrogenase E1 component subunit alpha n=1 Tax=Calditerricola satsumensis TaxID=373054 RepID=A0A8J3FC26_9BACI|nr:pyruvate dehydrogenase (acetyl-transferring) E1 component subunit alpha [Calditerricola satsumensis]GGJ98486.1 pyruvate dehydrogenase (acetyl-transferring) E1 component subunit alpha [Calditerricola satsumensis]